MKVRFLLTVEDIPVIDQEGPLPAASLAQAWDIFKSDILYKMKVLYPSHLKDTIRRAGTEVLMWDGDIPANTVCPFKAICELQQHCPHKGALHEVSFSCAAARSFILVEKEKDS